MKKQSTYRVLQFAILIALIFSLIALVTMHVRAAPYISALRMTGWVKDHVYTDIKDMNVRLDLYFGDEDKGWILKRELNDQGEVSSEEKIEFIYTYREYSVYEIESIGTFLEIGAPCLYFSEEFGVDADFARFEPWPKLEDGTYGEVPPMPIPTTAAPDPLPKIEPAKPSVAPGPQPAEPAPKPVEPEESAEPVEQDVEPQETQPQATEPQATEPQMKEPQPTENQETEPPKPENPAFQFPAVVQPEPPPTPAEETASSLPQEADMLVQSLPGLQARGHRVTIQDPSSYMEAIDRLYDKDTGQFCIEDEGLNALFPDPQSIEETVLSNGDWAVRFRNMTAHPIMGAHFVYRSNSQAELNVDTILPNFCLPGELSQNLYLYSGDNPFPDDLALSEMNLYFLDKLAGTLHVQALVDNQVITAVSFQDYNRDTVLECRFMDPEEQVRLDQFLATLQLTPTQMTVQNTYGLPIQSLDLVINYDTGESQIVSFEDGPIAPGESRVITSFVWNDDHAATTGTGRLVNFRVGFLKGSDIEFRGAFVPLYLLH